VVDDGQPRGFSSIIKDDARLNSIIIPKIRHVKG